jgi:uncharacterized membrane protein
MDRDLLAAKTLHLLGIILWLGGLLTVGWILALRDGETDAAFKTRMGLMARRLALVADIGAAIAILSGVYLLWQGRATLFKETYIFVKLGIVAVIVALHGIIRVKAKKASLGEGTFPKIVIQGLGVAMAATLYVVVFKP